MTIDRSRMLMLGGGGLVVVLLVGWVVLSRMADSRAEAHIVTFLDDYGVRDEVSWEKVSASPLGSTVRLDKVSLDDGSGAPLIIARIEITDFVDEQQRKRADVRMSGIAIGAGSPLAEMDFVHASGRAELPPANLNASWDLDFERDATMLKLVADQPGVARLTLDVELERVAPIVQFAEGARPGASSRRGPSNPFASPDALAIAIGMLETLGDVRLRRIAASIQDDGYVRRSIALHKRYKIPVDPSGAAPDKQRDEGFRKAMAEARTDCEREMPVANAADRKQACGTILDFVTGESRSISMKVNPARPVSVAAIFETAMKSPERIVTLLRPEIGR